MGEPARQMLGEVMCAPAQRALEGWLVKLTHHVSAPSQVSRVYLMMHVPSVSPYVSFCSFYFNPFGRPCGSGWLVSSHRKQDRKPTSAEEGLILYSSHRCRCASSSHPPDGDMKLSEHRRPELHSIHRLINSAPPFSLPLLPLLTD